MKSYFILLILCLAGLQVEAQSVVCTRTADLIRSPSYDVTGDAILELFDDNTVTLRLSDDFSTSRGPDVQIFLSTDSMDVSNAVSLVDIGSGDGLNHFSGSLDIDVPDGVTIDQYDHIVFRCFAFRVHWAHGNFTAKCSDDPDTTNNMMNMDTVMCMETIAATTNWVTERTVCAVDGEADIIPLANTQMIPAGDNYAYVFTDEARKIRFLHFEDQYNFEGSGPQTDYIYGVSYSGELVYNVGDDLQSITASECAIISDTVTFLTVMKEDCGEVYECLPTNTATTAWVINVSVCPTDGVADNILIQNNEFIKAGDNYAFIITDTFNIVKELYYFDSLDFEGRGLEPERIFGASFDGEISFVAGEGLSSISATGCLILSDSTLFLTVTKDACVDSFECESTAVSASGGDTSIEICETDGESDVITLANDKNITPGDNYAYLITDASDRIKFIERGPTYDFENSGTDTFRVYGVSHDGALQAAVADNVNDITTASGCLQLSSSFLTVIKGACTVDTSNMGSITIGGIVNNVKGSPLSGITVMLDGSDPQVTDNDGAYTFNEVDGSKEHVITASFEGAPLTGVTSSDIIASQQHILGLRPIENVYNLIAGDVNNSGTISATDLVIMRNVILGRADGFGDTGNWRFLDNVNDAQVIPTDKITIAPRRSDVSDANFIGIKVGDVNGNAVK